MAVTDSIKGARRRPLYGWLAAESISILGTRVSMIAIPLFVLFTTGSAARTGVVALAEMVPLVLVKLLAGPVIDRVGARRVGIVCDAGSALMVAVAPLLYRAGHLPFAAFVVLVACCGALRGPGDAAKNALIPSLVAHAGVPMERATGLASAVERTATMLGAALAGVLVAGVGAANALLVDAASFAVSAVVLAWATAGLETARADPGDDGDGADREPFRTQLAAGWHFLRGDRLLLGLAVMIALTNMLDAAFIQVLMPVWSTMRPHGAATLGLVLAVFSGASAVGALLAAAWAARLPRYSTYLVAYLVTGLPRFLVFALGAPLWTVLAVCVASGFASGFLNPVLGAVEFERIPAPLVGRVSAMMTALCWALMPFGGLLGGVLVESSTLGTALLLCGVAYLLVTVLPALNPTWREMDRRPATAPAAAVGP